MKLITVPQIFIETGVGLVDASPVVRAGLLAIETGDPGVQTD